MKRLTAKCQRTGLQLSTLVQMMSLCNKPLHEPMLVQISGAIWHHSDLYIKILFSLKKKHVRHLDLYWKNSCIGRGSITALYIFGGVYIILILMAPKE